MPSSWLQNGVVSEPARQAYEKLRTLEPQSIEPQVWLAIAREQDGDLKGAEAEYRTLLAGAEDPWKGLLEARLRALTDKVRRSRCAPRRRRTRLPRAGRR